MSTPWNSSRDSNMGGGTFSFGEESDVADTHLGAFRSSFAPPADQLSEQDYRDDDFGGGGTETVGTERVPEQNPQDYNYPWPGLHGSLGRNA